MNRIFYGLVIGACIIGALLAGEWYAILLFSILMFFSQMELGALSRKREGHHSDLRSILLITLGTLIFSSLIWSFYSEQFAPELHGKLIQIVLFVAVGYYLLRILKLFIHSRPGLLADLLDHAFYISLPLFLAYWICIRRDAFIPDVLLGVFFIIWASDSGAYYVGKNFGRLKLFPAVSPNKTWEGSLGGLISALIVCFALSFLFIDLDLHEWIMLGLLTWFFGSLGDLLESQMKRKAGIKDSGKILGGHGGILDRFDAFYGAIPFVAAYLYMIQ